MLGGIPYNASLDHSTTDVMESLIITASALTAGNDALVG